MDSTDLTPAQLNKIFAELAPIAHYLARVKARTVEQNFPRDKAGCRAMADLSDYALRLRQPQTTSPTKPSAARTTVDGSGTIVIDPL